MTVLVDKLGRDILLGSTAEWGFTVGSATTSVSTPTTSSVIVSFAGAAGPLTGTQVLTPMPNRTTFGTLTLDGKGGVVMPAAAYQFGTALAAPVVSPTGALIASFEGGVAGPITIGRMDAAGVNGGYAVLGPDRTLLVTQVAGVETVVATLAPLTFTGSSTVGVRMGAGGAWSVVQDGFDTGMGWTVPAVSQTGYLTLGSATGAATDAVASVTYQDLVTFDAAYALAHPAPTTTAVTLNFNGAAGVPTGTDALTQTPGSTVSIASMVLTGTGALSLGNSTSLTDATLTGIGTFGNGTITLNYATGTSDKQVRLMFGSYCWQRSGDLMELYGPNGQAASIPLAPSSSIGVSVNTGVLLCLVDGKVAHVERGLRTAMWGAVRIGTAYYPNYTQIDSIVVTATPLPEPVLAPQPTLPRQVSTSVPAGYLVLQAAVATAGPTNVVSFPGTLQTYALSGADVGYFFIQSNGTLTTLQTLTLGDKHINIITTDSASGLSRTDALTIPVPQGNLLASTAIQLAIPQDINNNTMSPVVGTPTVAGDTGHGSWTLFNKDAHIGDYGQDYRQLVADPTTGKVSFVVQAPARADGHDFTLSWSDGINTASRSFNVPVSWFVGPKVYVGPGNATSYPGYDHYFTRLTDLMMVLGNSYKLPDPAYAGAIIDADDGGNDDYFADDFQSDLYRAMWHGPFKMRGIGGPTGRRVRFGGHMHQINDGVAGGDKAFLLTNGGDTQFENIRFAWITGGGSMRSGTTGGRTGLRQNGDVGGDTTILNCQFDNCNNGFESGGGTGRVTIRYSVFFNCGGMTQGGGQTHAAYVNGAELIYEHNLSFNNNIGHCLKTRCGRGTIRFNTLADGAGGSASQQLNIPQAGAYLVDSNVLQKSATAQNPACIGYGEDDYGRDRHDLLTLTNNTFIVAQIDGAHNGSGIVLFHFPRVSTLDGAASVVNADGNKVFYSNPATQRLTDTWCAPINWTNTVTLTVPPALNFADPGTANPPAETPPRFICLFYYGGDNYALMDGVQITPAVKDIRVSATAPAGTVLTLLTPYGNDLAKYDNIPNDPTINPFVAGSTWRISTDPEYFAGAVWPPAGRYKVVPSADGTTATLQVGTAGLVANRIDTPKVEVTAPDGTKAAWRFPVSVAA